MCCLFTILFFGGWHPGFPTGFLESWARPAGQLLRLPGVRLQSRLHVLLGVDRQGDRAPLRYDQLMRLGWKVFLPTSLVAVIAVAAWRVFGPEIA
jgi:NADH-quinone oxidoreductase subunit H